MNIPRRQGKDALVQRVANILDFCIDVYSNTRGYYKIRPRPDSPAAPLATPSCIIDMGDYGMIYVWPTGALHRTHNPTVNVSRKYWPRNHGFDVSRTRVLSIDQVCQMTMESELIRLYEVANAGLSSAKNRSVSRVVYSYNRRSHRLNPCCV